MRTPKQGWTDATTTITISVSATDVANYSSLEGRNRQVACRLWLQKRMRLAATTSNLLRLHLRENLKSFHGLSLRFLNSPWCRTYPCHPLVCFLHLFQCTVHFPVSAELLENNSGDVLSACGLQVRRGRAAPCWMPERPAKISKNKPCLAPTVSARADQCDQTSTLYRSNNASLLSLCRILLHFQSLPPHHLNMEMEDAAKWRQKSEFSEHVLPSADSDPFLHPHILPSYSSEANNSLSEATAYPTRHYHVSFAVLAYICLALFAWISTCILSFRPFFWPTYFADTTQTLGYSDLGHLYSKNQRWFQATRVLQSIVSVLAIPLTSAICAKAAVVFTQRSSRRTSLSLRQTMALADKGWASPATVLRASTPQGFKHIGSSFLLIAVVINLLGLRCPALVYEQ